MKLNAALLAVAVAFALAACKPAETPATDSGAEAAPPADATTQPTDAAPPTDGASASTGIAECDEYITKIKACIVDTVPENMREEMLKGFDQVTAAWSAPGVDKAGLPEACKSAMEQASSTYGAMGCTF